MLATVRPVLPLLAAALIMVCGVALGNLLTPLRANAEGWSASTIGIITASYSTAFTIGCVFVPAFVKRTGHLTVHGLALCLMAASVALMTQWVHPLAWALFLGSVGFGAACAYAVLEAWLNEHADNQTRGTIFSWYMLACLGGTIVGQIALPLSHPSQATLFVVAAVAFVAAILPVALSRMVKPAAITSAAIDFAAIWRNSPAAVVGGLLSGAMFGTWTAFAAVHAGNLGHDGAAIATLMMAGTIGGMLLQFPVGRWSDRMDRRLMMIILGTVGAIAALAAAIWMPTTLLPLAVIYFFMGGTLHPSYAVNVAHANDHADNGSFVGVSGAMLVVFGIGSVSGPFLGGLLIDALGYQAFFVWLALAYLAYLLHPIWRMRKRRAPARKARSIEEAISSGAARRP
jgi:MFS family permease